MAERILVTPSVLESGAATLQNAKDEFEGSLQRANNAVLSLSNTWLDALCILALEKYETQLKGRLDEIPMALGAFSEMITNALRVFESTDAGLKAKVWTTIGVAEAAGVCLPNPWTNPGKPYPTPEGANPGDAPEGANPGDAGRSDFELGTLRGSDPARYEAAKARAAEKLVANGVYNDGYDFQTVGGLAKEHGGHTGIDVFGPGGNEYTGAEIVYPFNEPATVVREGGGFGGTVTAEVVVEGKTYTIVFAHMEEVNFKPGDTIDKGAILGTVGDTGSNSGGIYHLHFEIREGTRETWSSNFIDPVEFIEKYA